MRVVVREQVTAILVVLENGKENVVLDTFGIRSPAAACFYARSIANVLGCHLVLIGPRFDATTTTTTGGK